MKNFFRLLVLFIPFFAHAQQSKTTRVYSEDGHLQMLIRYDPSCSCRTYTEYFPDGKIYAKRTFKVDAKSEYIDGEDITYFHDGTIRHYKVWKNAFPSGRAYSNYEGGQLEHEAFYSGKYKSGTWKYFNRKGELAREIKYPEGKVLWNSKEPNSSERAQNAQKTIAEKEKQSDRKSVADKARVFTGKKLFFTHCSSCHSIEKDGFGPALRGVTERRDRGWLSLMITNGMLLVREGEPQATALYHKWRKKQHPLMDFLTREEVTAILDYLEEQK